jgi:chemotaxis protein histidine kinase CheA
MDKINQNIIKLKSGTSKKDIAEFTSESSFLKEKIEKTITNIDKNEFQRDVMLGMFKNFYVLTISAKNNNYKDIEEICIEVGNLINHIVNDNIVMTEEIMNTLSTTLNAIKRQLRNIEKSPDIKPEPPFPDKYEIISNIKKLTDKILQNPQNHSGKYSRNGINRRKNDKRSS